MPNTILVDTGFLVALFRRGDPYAASAKALLAGRLKRERPRLVTVYPVITETCFFFHPADGARFLDWVHQGGVILRQIEPLYLPEIAALLRRYADQRIDFADACLIWLAGQEKTHRVLTTDRRDFSIYRAPDGRPFERVWLADAERPSPH